MRNLLARFTVMNLERKLAERLPQGSFQRLLKHYRVRAGLSRRALSDISGLSPSYVSKVEGGSMPSLESFSHLVKNLDCSNREVLLLVFLASSEGNVSEGT